MRGKMANTELMGFPCRKVLYTKPAGPKQLFSGAFNFWKHSALGSMLVLRGQICQDQTALAGPRAMEVSKASL